MATKCGIFETVTYNFINSYIDAYAYETQIFQKLFKEM